MKIYITRHGETKWNIEGRIQGHLDSELTHKGIEGAKKLKERLSRVDIDLIVSSPLERAHKTARIIKGNREIDIELNSKLKEINCGEFQGNRFEDIWRENPGVKDRIRENPFGFIYPDGESLEIFYKRVTKGFHEILEKHEGKDILVVAHGGTIRSIVAEMFDKPDGSTWFNNVVDNCSLSLYDYDGENFKEIIYNDTSHLNS
ncbi:MAG: histidine phosphatase family protein [Bacillota bacterium]|nr:histidine phosphatase family protein [Bacillota bacterium]